MARAGRKRKLVRRHPNGQPFVSVAKQEEETKSVALEARVRVYGVTKEAAVKDMKSTTWLGAMLATKEISETQYAAANRLIELKRDYDRCFPPSQDVPEAGILDRVRGRSVNERSEDEEAAEDRRIRKQWDEAIGALNEASHNPDHMRSVISAGVFEDRDVRSYAPTLRVGLSAVARTFSL